MVTRDNIISDYLVNKRSLRDTEMARRSLLKILRKNIVSYDDENEVAEKEKRERSRAG